jgi:hypothetical protein
MHTLRVHPNTHLAAHSQGLGFLRVSAIGFWTVFPAHNSLERAKNTRVQKFSAVLAEMVNRFEGLKGIPVGTF